MDILALCNVNGTGVSCVDSTAGADLRTRHSPGHGHMLDLPAAGRPA